MPSKLPTWRCWQNASCAHWVLFWVGRVLSQHSDILSVAQRFVSGLVNSRSQLQSQSLMFAAALQQQKPAACLV